MELIAEIENSERGLYGGAIVSLDAKGNLISCIAIRTTVLKGGTMFVRAGAGIVLDSDPMREAAETVMKAKTVLEVANVLNHR
jgi:anthranilate synthase component I